MILALLVHLDQAVPLEIKDLREVLDLWDHKDLLDRQVFLVVLDSQGRLVIQVFLDNLDRLVIQVLQALQVLLESWETVEILVLWVPLFLEQLVQQVQPEQQEVRERVGLPDLPGELDLQVSRDFEDLLAITDRRALLEFLGLLALLDHRVN